MLRILFGLEGRIGRRNYLLAIVGQWAILMGLFFAFGSAMLAVFGMAGIDLSPGATPPTAENLSPKQALMASGVGVASIIFMILFLGLSLYMGVAAQVKRLHDMNLSGWLTLINFASMPIAMSLVAADRQTVAAKHGQIALKHIARTFGHSRKPREKTSRTVEVRMMVRTVLARNAGLLRPVADVVALANVGWLNRRKHVSLKPLV